MPQSFHKPAHRMDQFVNQIVTGPFVEALRSLSGLLAVLVPLLKSFLGRSPERSNELDDRFQRVKKFFDEGGVERHPLLVEASFASAVGHAKLDAREIRLVLRQPRPTRFIAAYVRVRDYLAPTKDGKKFELQALASHERLRKALVVAGVVLYVLFGFTAVGLTMYVAPRQALAQSWGHLTLALASAPLFVVTGALCLIGASKLHWAKELESKQAAPLPVSDMKWTKTYSLTVADNRVFRVFLSEHEGAGFHANCLWYDKGRMSKAPDQPAVLNFHHQQWHGSSDDEVRDRVLAWVGLRFGDHHTLTDITPPHP